jgi:DNA-binding NarL/FixJ family response regulator
MESEEIIHQVLAAGARGYVLKSDAGSQIIPAIKSLCEHKPYLTSRAAEVVLDSYLADGPDAGRAAPVGLTPREREVVQLLAEGKSNKEVATALGISVKTAETHRATVMHKLGFKTFSEMVRYAVRNHIVSA